MTEARLARSYDIVWLDKAYEERIPQLLLIPFEPLIDPIRDDPRFQNLVKRIGIPVMASSKVR